MPKRFRFSDENSDPSSGKDSRLKSSNGQAFAHHIPRLASSSSAASSPCQNPFASSLSLLPIPSITATFADFEIALNISDDESCDKSAPVTSTSSARPLAVPRSREERFVPGLFTFVGGLQMSRPALREGQNDDIEDEQEQEHQHQHEEEEEEEEEEEGGGGGGGEPTRAPQPLLMSRQPESDNPQTTISSTSQHANSRPSGPDLVPGVSPGWHVESRAMELHEGIRHKDEDGWTPLDSFPARTTLGRSIARRARLRLASLRASRKSSPTTRNASADLMSIKSMTTPSPVTPQSFQSRMVTNSIEGQSTELDTLTNSISPRSSLSVPAQPVHTLNRPAPIISFRNGLPHMVNPFHSQSQALQALIEPVAPSKPTYTLKDFEVLETLGTGTFGRVMLVRLKHRDASDPSAYFALKVLSKAQVVRLKQVEHIISERRILGAVDHPFLVNLVDTFQDELNCYMLMEYVVGGEIFSYLRRAGRFSTDVARFYISTIVMAIEYLHERNIIYRDLKPENLLLDEHGYTKVTDFGFAKEVTDRTWTLCGTPEYLAPEIIQSKGHGKAVDWWALGILLFEMLAGYPPFYDSQPFGVYEKILQGQIVYPAHIDPVARDLIRSLLTADRSKRLGNLRGGSQDVKNHPWFHGVDWSSLATRSIPPPILPVYSNPGSTCNFCKYQPADPASMPGLFPQHRQPNLLDLHAHLFPHF